MATIAAARRNLTTTPGQGIQSPLNATVANTPINPFTNTPWFIGSVFTSTFTQTVPISGTPSVLQFTTQVPLKTFPSQLSLSHSTTGTVLASVCLATTPDSSLQLYLPQLKFQSSQGTLATSASSTTGSFQLQNGAKYTNPVLVVTYWVNDTNSSPIAAGLPVTLAVWAMLVGQSAQSNVVP